MSLGSTGDIQESLEGSCGREGKYFVWRFSRKLGSEGSRDGCGVGGKCIDSVGSVGSELGGSEVGGSEVGGSEVGGSEVVADGSVGDDCKGILSVGSGAAKETFFVDAGFDAGPVALSSFDGGAVGPGSSRSLSLLPWWIFDRASSFCSRAGFRLCINSCRSCSISSCDMAANLSWFSLSMACLS